MFEFFDFLVNVITVMFHAVSRMIVSVVEFIKQIIMGVAFLSATVQSFPPFCQGALCMILAISVVTMLISFFVDSA